ncbi:tRNA lysidine(34) synthetase TilS [Spirosoma sp. KNUC1025]|uniref:tRNA lysidine(34) synthetase TilS n=1 Tax=Spirosoma sp. KNUC1025 TaxID=2894082 RepID=UPI003869F448|nr:tRNA lysidine(34) synthetase TilS [Spirosoma sp. KNUC1025]
MERDFLGFINDNHLFGPTDRVLLAVSGGLDSMVMTELVHRIGQPFAIAHVNFGLRGEESNADARFVQNKAEQYGVPFHLTQVDTKAVAEERGISIQMAARELRYAWFRQLLSENNYACVATAHHLNDVLETVLLNFTRGTGIAGLHGIAVNQNQVVRPLLFASRDQLVAYYEANKLTHREDSSNPEDKYARNRIRHHVVPVLTELNPALWQTFPRTVDRLRAAETLLRTELERSWQEISEPWGEQTLLRSDKLLSLSELPFRLSEWLKPFGFMVDQVEQMTNALTQSVGQQFLSPTHRIIHERNGLVLEPLRLAPDYEIRLTDWPSAAINVTGHFALAVQLIDKPDNIPTNPAVACLDADKLTFPITIRPWRQGDRFRPLGLNGHKLVSDLLNDLKLSRSERERTAVLLSGDSIAWVIGRRIDHRFRITPTTQRVCQLTLLNRL